VRNIARDPVGVATFERKTSMAKKKPAKKVAPKAKKAAPSKKPAAKAKAAAPKKTFGKKGPAKGASKHEEE
jgi:hypothetical protein